jgi:hypothetical protein
LLKDVKLYLRENSSIRDTHFPFTVVQFSLVRFSLQYSCPYGTVAPTRTPRNPKFEAMLKEIKRFRAIDTEPVAKDPITIYHSALQFRQKRKASRSMSKANNPKYPPQFYLYSNYRVALCYNCAIYSERCCLARPVFFFMKGKKGSTAADLRVRQAYDL